MCDCVCGCDCAGACDCVFVDVLGVELWLCVCDGTCVCVLWLYACDCVIVLVCLWMCVCVWLCVFVIVFLVVLVIARLWLCAGCGPSGNTASRNSRLRSGGEHCHPAFTVEVRRGTTRNSSRPRRRTRRKWKRTRRTGRRRRKPADKKSNNPHLAGNYIYKQWIYTNDAKYAVSSKQVCTPRQQFSTNTKTC